MYINRILHFLDIINCPISYMKQHFGDWIPSPSPSKKPTHLGSIVRASPLPGHQKQHKAGYRNHNRTTEHTKKNLVKIKS
jgi:hypothetical protein